MPANSDGVYRDSGHGLTVTARVLPSGDCRVHLCLAGEIDMEASAVLAKITDWLTALAPVSVLVDLAELTFACAALPNFVARLRQALPHGAELILWRARPGPRGVLSATDMATIATIRDEISIPIAARDHIYA